MKAVLAGLALVGAVSPLSGCGNAAPGIDGRVETMDERIKRQEAEFNATPDIKGKDLRTRLNAAGVKDSWMTPAIEEHGVEVLELRVPETAFAKLDHRALAKLRLDSRYRFDFVDPQQAHVAALYNGAELNEREQAKALRELSERGQLETYPKYREGMLLGSYAARLEAWCGYKRGQALRLVDGNWIDYQHSMVDLAVADRDGRASASFDCMKRVVDASPQLRRRFIGNRGREGAIDY